MQMNNGVPTSRNSQKVASNASTRLMFADHNIYARHSPAARGRDHFGVSDNLNTIVCRIPEQFGIGIFAGIDQYSHRDTRVYEPNRMTIA